METDRTTRREQKQRYNTLQREGGQRKEGERDGERRKGKRSSFDSQDTTQSFISKVKLIEL